MTPQNASPAASQPGFNGILNVDKPAGWTSHDVVGWVRRLLRQHAVGHCGTLDPLATGVLLVCVGESTRVAEYLMGGEKVYRAVARFGIATDTYDSAGLVTATAEVPVLSASDIAAALRPFVGDILQVPPLYSAIKRDGVPSYRLARQGCPTALAPRAVHISQIEVSGWQPPYATLDVTCGPGTYIRSLVHDLGQSLGCGANMSALIRLRSGSFRLDEAASLEQLAGAVATGQLTHYLHPLATALRGLISVHVEDPVARRLAQGQPIPCPVAPPADLGCALNAAGEALAVLAYRQGQWWPHKVFSAARADAYVEPAARPISAGAAVETPAEQAH